MNICTKVGEGRSQPITKPLFGGDGHLVGIHLDEQIEIAPPQVIVHARPEDPD
jgi:hypothetical protein